MSTLNRYEGYAPKPGTMLLPLEVRGSGGMVEALSSYIERLAAHHSVTTRSLIFENLVPQLQERGLSAITERSIRGDGGLICLSNQNVRDLINLLTELTGVPGLAQSTLLGTEGLIARASLVRRPLCCTTCLEEMASAKSERYFPLIWFIHGVSACPVHLKALSVPKCTRHSPRPRSGATFPWNCPTCGGDILGCCVRSQHAPSEGELWASAQISDLVGHGTTHSKELFLANFLKLSEQMHGGHYITAAKALSIPKSTMFAIVRKPNTKVNLRDLLKIAHGYGVRLLDLVSGEVSAPRKVSQPLELKNPRKPRSAVPENVARDALIAAAKRFPPASLQSVASRLGCDPATLRSRFRIESLDLSAKRSVSLKARKLERKENALLEALALQSLCRARGKKLTRRTVEKFTGKPWRLSYLQRLLECDSITDLRQLLEDAVKNRATV